MIKTDTQRERTLTQIDGFRRALAQAAAETSAKRSAAIRGSYEGMIHHLEDEVREYDRLKAGKFRLPTLERLDQIAPFIVKLRIARGVSQTELASRLGVSKQVVSRSEEDDYQGVSLSRLQEILDALQVRTKISLTA
ncbi:MAG: helix-turn-helix transcriptional regulator [Bryobacteraceae bacterium]